MPTVDEIRQRLLDQGLKVDSENRLPNDSGTQIRLVNGGIVNCYDTGTFNVQGADQPAVKAALADFGQPPRKGRALRAAAPASPTARSAPQKVFVVYGRDQQARAELDAMLRRWGLEPLFLDKLPSEGTTIIEKLEATRSQASYAVVLATPDDVGYMKGRENEKKSRVRQNVVLELGMVLAALGRPNVAILLKKEADFEPPSDINGLNYIEFKEHVEDAALPLAKEMKQRGVITMDVERL